MEFFSPYVELLRKRFPATLSDIRSAGFDGVECHLVGDLKSRRRIEEVRADAAQMGLKVQFHQGYSWRTAQPGFYKVAMGLMRALVPVGMPLARQVRDADDDPVVVYGNLASENSKPHYRYQAASEYVNGHLYAGTFERFAYAVQAKKVPVVFDTQHTLEWSLDIPNVEGLPVEPMTLMDKTSRLWYQLSPNIVEVHLCDFRPQLGRTQGRNVFLGDGVFPLKDFCKMLKGLGWDGTVVPEVAFQHLTGRGRLLQLRKHMDTLFR